MHSHRCMKIMTPPEGGCHPITIIVTLICCSSMRRCIWQLKLHRGCTQEREGAYCLFETQPPTEPTMVYTACSNFRNTLKSPQLLCVVHLRVSWCCTFPPKNSHFQLCDFEIPPIISKLPELYFVNEFVHLCFWVVFVALHDQKGPCFFEY